MTNTRKTILLILLCSIAAPATAQGVDKIIKPRKKQHTAFYLKAQYASPSLDVVSAVRSDIAQSKALGVMSHSAIGLSVRIPLWRVIYIQPEILYSLQTNWDSAALRTGFFPQTAYAFNHRERSNIDIPLNIGLRWEPAKIFAARAYVGPMMRLHLSHGSFSLYDNYTLRFGIGIDLFNFLTLDAGYCVEMNKLTIFDETGHYLFGLGIKL